MIFDRIKNIENYKNLQRIYEALHFLASLEPNELPSSTVYIDGDTVFANPGVLISKPVKECVYESHRKYIDIHYTVSGVEGISTADAESLKVIKNYEHDILFYDGCSPVDTTCWLAPGCFMICFPNDAHRAAMMMNAPAEIKKIVVKVKV